MRLHNIASFAILVALLIPCAVYGVDGVILIDQNKALAGNVTPGDTPGFPVIISQPGSYRLDSNLTVPDVKTTAILITSSNVTIDLNGFSILGPNVCGPVTIAGQTFFSCVPGGDSGTGLGITNLAPGGDPPVLMNITIRNGTVQGMGSDGINLDGTSVLIERLHATSNGGGGISISGGIVQENTAKLNQAFGISAQECLVSHNVTLQNKGNGIEIVNGIVVQNVIMQNKIGLFLGGVAGYLGNLLIGNVINVETIIGDAVNQGQNICGTTVCP